MAKIKQEDANTTRVIKAKTNKNPQNAELKGYKWWLANSKREVTEQVLATFGFLKQQQQYRYRAAALHARMASNISLFNFVGSSLNKIVNNVSLPIDRPTMNVVQSCIDTKVSRLTQSRPRPVFLTDNGDYKQRKLAKDLNRFLMGEFYSCQAYDKAEMILRDAEIFGTGALKIVETLDKKVGLQRRLLTELLFDHNEARIDEPRQMYEVALVDRQVLAQYFPEHRSEISKAEQAYPDNSGDATRTVSDQVMVVEAWRLPSGKGTGDGRHVIVCSSGCILDEEWTQDKFPFVFLHDSPPILGAWGQGVPERLMGTQVEINKLLMTISQSINLVGVPRVFVEEGSKVMKTAHNNQIGAIITYRGTKPIYEVAPCIAPEIYAQLQRLIEYAYNQEGVSTMAAQSKKPAGLNSGAAIRENDDIQSDRLASLQKRWQKFFEDLGYAVFNKAQQIAKETGKYSTIYPDKDGTHEIDLPKLDEEMDPYVIQCFDSSSLPRDPAGRLERVVEMTQSGMISPDEGRRLLSFPDIEQIDKLANAAEERIFRILDKIVEDGDYTPPDSFINRELALKFTNQYYNLYAAAKLEESRLEMLRQFMTAIVDLQMASQPPAPMPMEGVPQANPEPLPTNPMIPNVPIGA
jgi:hypothetical protein